MYKIIEIYLSCIGIYHSGRPFKRSCSIISHTHTHKKLYKDITFLQEMTLIFVQHKTTYSRLRLLGNETILTCFLFACVGINAVEPGYNDIGLYQHLAYRVRYPVVPINSLLLSITLYSSDITTLIYSHKSILSLS